MAKKPKQPSKEDRLAEEQKHDAEVKSRTSRYDQDIKERARKLSINPDNFETESELKRAVLKAEGVDL